MATFFISGQTSVLALSWYAITDFSELKSLIFLISGQTSVLYSYWLIFSISEQTSGQLIVEHIIHPQCRKSRILEDLIDISIIGPTITL